MNKKIVISSAIALTMLISGTALAAAYKSPAESVSDLTKIPVEELYEQRAEGKTYGEIAEENGVLDQFKDEMLKNKFSIIDERVKEGRITEENAEALKKAMEERVQSCDGTPDANRPRLGQQYGGGMGFGAGMGQGRGQGRGAGSGQGRGQGLGMGQGGNFNNK